MVVREVGPEQREEWENLVSSSHYGHVLQSWDWGEFKKLMGNPPSRIGVFDQDKLIACAQYTRHPVPYTQKFIAYLPKGPTASLTSSLKPILEGLQTSVRESGSVFLKIEPAIPEQETESLEWGKVLSEGGARKSQKDVFARHTFFLDLTKTEEEILSGMHEKWRYNIRLSERKGVVIEEKADEASLEEFIQLQRLTSKRNKFYVHEDQYYRNLWLTLQPKGIAHLLVAKFGDKTLASWMLFRYGRTLYYPYGSSGEEGRELMPSHALMWGAIKFGKKLDCARFDLWGASLPNSINDPWWGFTRFKAGFGGNLVSFLGAYDMVIEPRWYRVLNIVDNARWWLLKLKSRI